MEPCEFSELGETQRNDECQGRVEGAARQVAAAEPAIEGRKDAQAQNPRGDEEERHARCEPEKSQHVERARLAHA